MREIQKKVDETLSIVTEVRKGSLSLEEISDSIAGAAEEQSTTVKEVAKSISQAATASADIARRISSISQTTKSGLEDAMLLEEAAISTDEAAKALRQTVASFRV
jgi:methyl-accepting chemotaxis protein